MPFAFFRSWMEFHEPIEYAPRHQVANRALGDEFEIVRNVRKAYETAGAGLRVPVAEHHVWHCVIG